MIAPNVNSPKCLVQITKQMVCECLQRKHLTFGLSMISINETWQTKFIPFFNTATRLLDEEKYPRHKASGFQKYIWRFSQLSLWTSQSNVGHWMSRAHLCACTKGGDSWISVRQVETIECHVPALCSWLCFIQPIYQYLFELSLQLLVSYVKAEAKFTNLFSSHCMFIIVHTLFKLILSTAH